MDAHGNPIGGASKQEPEIPAVPSHPDVIEMTSVDEWVPLVMQAEVPIVLDCYAE
jgi:hypothetical protein